MKERGSEFVTGIRKVKFISTKIDPSYIVVGKNKSRCFK